MRFKEFITEVFDKTYPFEWERKHGRQLTAYFYAADKSLIGVDMAYGPEESAFLMFNRGGQTKMTGDGDAQKIFATVVKIAREMAEELQPTAIIFSADKDGKREGRAALYKRMADRLALPGFVRLTDPEDIKNEGKLKEMLRREQNRTSYEAITIIRKSLLKDSTD